MGDPNYENGVILLGDLWDRRTSKRVGFNLFGKKITTNIPSNVTPVRVTNVADPSKFVFKHVKNSDDAAKEISLGAEVTCELLGGIIKITGGLKFELGWSSGMSSEEILLIVDYPKSDIALNGADVTPLFDEHVKRLLDKEMIDNVEDLLVVTKIQIGGRMMSTIKVTQTKSGDKFKLDVYLNGEVNLGVLSGKVGLNVGVGEEINITNYEASIDLSSMPPIPAPTSVIDFISEDPNDPNTNNSKILQWFRQNLDKQKHFEFWKKFNGEVALVGVPMKFELSPLSLYYTPTPTPPPPPPPTPPDPFAFRIMNPKLQPDLPLLEELQVLLTTFRDWIGPSYCKRTLLATGEKMVQKILATENHELAIRVNIREKLLQTVATDTRLILLKAYIEYKRTNYNDDGKLSQAVQDGQGVVANQKQDLEKTFFPGFLLDARREWGAVNVDAPPPDPNDPSGSEEEMSPLVYFTHAEDLKGWLQARRFCKLLIRTKPFEGGGRNKWADVISPSVIYKMSHALGKLLVQPGIAYPTLITNDQTPYVLQNEPSFKILTLQTPNGKMIFTEETNQDAVFLIQFLQALSGYNPDTGYFGGDLHLYQTYCELHGLVLDIRETVDLIPLIKIQQNVFGPQKLALHHSFDETKKAIASTGNDKPTLFISTDGVQTFRQILHSLLLLQQLKVGEDTLSFEVIAGPVLDYPEQPHTDTPPIFLAWGKRVQVLCFNHLDLLVLIYHLSKKSELEEIKDILDIDRIDLDRELCSPQRIAYVKEVKGYLTTRSQKEENEADINSKIEKIKQETPPQFFLTKILASVVKEPRGVVNVANEVARMTREILGDEFLPDFFGDQDHWQDDIGQFIISATDSTKWESVFMRLDREMYDGKFLDILPDTVLFKFYQLVNNYVLAFLLWAEPIPIPQPELPLPEDGTSRREGEEEKPVDPEQQYEMLKEIMEKPEFIPYLIPEFVDDVNKIHGIPNLNFKTSARLYATLMQKQKTYTDSRESGIGAMQHLKAVARSIADGARVSSAVMDEVVYFTAKYEKLYDAKPTDKLPPEVLKRTQNNIKLKRYYHLLSDLTEHWEANNEKEDGQLALFQLEMQRMTALTDWLNLIRVIQELGNFVDTGTSFLERLWRNKKFELMIQVNIDIPYVLQKLREVFIIDGSVPNYVPGDIARKILAHDNTPGRDPIGFSPVWSTPSILLKSFQILWVLKNRPERFQRYLLSNTIDRNNPTYEILRKNMVQFYWQNEQAKRYYTEAWNLEDIYQVIMALMGEIKPEKDEKFLRQVNGVKKSEKSPRTLPLNFARAKMTNGIPTQLSPGLESRNAEVGINSYLVFQPSPNEPTRDGILYNLKHLKHPECKIANSFNPFLREERIEILTILLQSSSPPIQSEISDLLKSAFSKNYALPGITAPVSQEENPNTLLDYLLKDYFTNGNLPKVITAINLSDSRKSSEGKTDFLNGLVAKDKKAFSETGSGKVSAEYFRGYTEVLFLNAESGKPEFWKEMGENETVLLINLHADALKLPHRLNVLKPLTSCFLLFWDGELSSGEIETARNTFREMIHPYHSLVELYVNPSPELVGEIAPHQVIKTPIDEGTNLESNFENGVRALKSCLTRRARIIMSSGEEEEKLGLKPRKKKWDEGAQQFMRRLKGSLTRFKDLLFLQKGRKKKSEQDLQKHTQEYPEYLEMLSSFAKLIKESGDKFLAVMSDLSELLFLKGEEEKTYEKAWRTLKQEESANGNGYESKLIPNKKRYLLSFVQKGVDNHTLSILDLIFELYHLSDFGPAFFPQGEIEREELLSNLAFTFKSGQTLLIPSLIDEGFFAGKWSQDFLSLIPSGKRVLVLNTICTDNQDVNKICDALFGISFTSPRTQWKESRWAGFYMRWIHFEGKVQEETGLDGILLLNAKPLGTKEGKIHKNLGERERQIATFLFAIANLTLVIDYDENNAEFKSLLQTSLLGLNKIPEREGQLIEIEKTTRLFFVGSSLNQDATMIENLISETKEFMDKEDHTSISTMGIRVVEHALSDLRLDNPVFDIPKDKKLSVLSDAIINMAKKVSSECPDLPWFLDNLNPIWDYIRDNILFPIPDLPELEKREEFYEDLYKILDLIDASFTHHCEDSPGLLYEGMSNIVYSWLNKEEGQIALAKKKELNLIEVTSRVAKIIESCDLGEEEGDACHNCIAVVTAMELLLQKWKDDGSPYFTDLKMMDMISSYREKERIHYDGMSKQMMSGIEETLLLEENDCTKAKYKKELNSAENKGFTEGQILSLELRVVRSERRMKAEIKEFYEGVKFPWEINIEEGFSFLGKIPAFRDGETLNQDQAKELEKKLRPVPLAQIKFGGYAAVYQSGMVRRTAASISIILANLEEDTGKKVIPNFKLRVASHTLWRLNEIFGISEREWNKMYNPLVVAKFEDGN